MSRSPVEPGDGVGDLVAVLTTMELLAAVAEGTEPAAAGHGYATRRALRRIASGVTVLTLDRDGLWHGVTVSAVLPISRNPLVVGACLRTSSAFTAMVADQPYFSINVLGADQAPVAARFADPARGLGDAQFAGLRWTVDQHTGAPLIGDCVAHLSCLVNDCLPVGDHELIIAEVIGGAAHAGSPLLTFAGRLQPEFAARPGLSRATSQRNEP